jgi:hypothetical protein
MSLAFDIVPDAYKNCVLKLFGAAKIFSFQTVTHLQAILKMITDTAKKYGELLFPEWWKWLINWETLGGYRSTVEISVFEDELREWAEGDVIHKSYAADGLLTEETFLDDLTEGMWEFLRDLPNVVRANSRALTLHDWVRQPGAWARAGSTQRTESVLYTDREGKIRKARKTKWRAALAMDPSMVERVILEHRPTRLVQRNVAIQKREPGKVRAVVNAGDDDYWRMSYISHWLEYALQGSVRSTLYMRKEQLVEMWKRLARACDDPALVKIPLDQSHFDWQQNKRMIARFLSVVRRTIETYCTPRVKADMLEALWRVEQSLVVQTGFIEVGSGSDMVRIPINKGVMSGWRWTALMDTVFNWGELFAARQLVKRMGFSEVVVNATAQGDDDQVACNTYSGASALVIAYNIMNFEVNPGKFFVSTQRDEYLRQVMQPHIVSGYGVRGVNAILWRNPISRDPPAGLLRLGEQLKQWNLLLGRGGERRTIIPLMLRDLSQGNGLSTQEVVSVLSTPAAAGGLGFMIRADRWYSLERGRQEVKANFVLSTVRGLDVELVLWRKLGIPLSKHDAMQGLRENLELPRAETQTFGGTVRETRMFTPFLWEPARMQGGFPLAGRANHTLPKTLVNQALRYAIENKMWRWIHEVYTPVELRERAKKLEQRGGRRVWLAWLEDSLPWRIPTIPGNSDLDVSLVYNEYARGAWTRINSKSKFSMHDVKRAALTAELWCIDAITGSSVRLGG